MTNTNTQPEEPGQGHTAEMDRGEAFAEAIIGAVNCFGPLRMSQLERSEMATILIQSAAQYVRESNLRARATQPEAGSE